MNLGDLSGKLGDHSLGTVFLSVSVAGVLIIVTMSIGVGAAAGYSAGLGVVTALSNLYVLSRIVSALAVPHVDSKQNAAFAWGVIALGKIMVLFGGLWFLMTRHLVDPIPLVVGYGSLPIGIAIGAVVSEKTGPRSS